MPTKQEIEKQLSDMGFPVSYGSAIDKGIVTPESKTTMLVSAGKLYRACEPDEQSILRALAMLHDKAQYYSKLK